MGRTELFKRVAIHGRGDPLGGPLDRGVSVDHTTVLRWIQAYAVELEKRIRPHLRMSNGSWRMDET